MWPACTEDAYGGKVPICWSYCLERMSRAFSIPTAPQRNLAVFGGLAREELLLYSAHPELKFFLFSHVPVSMVK